MPCRSIACRHCYAAGASWAERVALARLAAVFAGAPVVVRALFLYNGGSAFENLLTMRVDEQQLLPIAWRGNSTSSWFPTKVACKMKRHKTSYFMRALVVFAASLMLVLATGAAAQAGAVEAPLAQSGGTIAVAKADSVNIRSGPSTGYPVVGSLAYGQSCPVIGRDTISGWWLLQCPNGVTGWVSPDLVNIIGDPNGVPLYTVAGPTPSQPQPQPTPPPSGWSASYFANRDLQGNPVLVQTVQDINFNWGYGSPGPSVPPAPQ